MDVRQYEAIQVTAGLTQNVAFNRCGQVLDLVVQPRLRCLKPFGTPVDYSKHRAHLRRPAPCADGWRSHFPIDLMRLPDEDGQLLLTEAIYPIEGSLPHRQRLLLC